MGQSRRTFTDGFKADAAELNRLRKENKCLALENEILQIGEQANATYSREPVNAFSPQGQRRHERET